MLQDCVLEGLDRYGWEPLAWVILPDHYHFLARGRRGEDLSRIEKWIHSRSAFLLRRDHGGPKGKVWWQYWDTLVRDEESLWTHCEYIHWNPVKHGHVEHPRDWPYSSLKQLRADDT